MFPIGTSGWGSPYVRRDTQEQIDYVNENNRNEGVNTFSVFVYTMPGESAEGVVKVPGHLSNAQLRQLAALRDASLGFVDNTSSDISFNGTWAKQDDGMDFRGSTNWSAVADNHAEMAFTGTGVEVAVRKGSNGGLVDVVLDGAVVVDDFDTYSSTTAYRQVIYENQNLSSGSHTIRLVATGQKNASATEADAMLDYFAVTRLDTKAPRVLSITSDATHPTKDPFTVTIDFLEDVTGLTAGEIAVNNGTGSNLTGTGASYTLDIEPIANLEGEVTVRVPADAAVDGANNGNIEGSETFAVDAQAPVGLTAMPGDEAVRLEWSPPASDGDSPILRYEYRLKDGRGEFGEWIPIPDSAADEANATGYTVADLGNGTAYVFELRAVNAAGNGRVSEPAEVRMPLDPAYWSNFLAEDLEGAQMMLEAFFSGGRGDREVRFGEGLRFEEDELDGQGEVTATRMGGYGYRYTSRTTGELRLDYDGGESCELRLTFRGEGAGSYSIRCGGVLGGQGSFRMSGLN